MKEETPNKLDTVTIDAFLRGEEAEDRIAIAVVPYISAFGLDRVAVGDMPVSKFLHNNTYRGFEDAYLLCQKYHGGEYSMDYNIGYAMGTSVRVQGTLKGKQ